MFLIFSLCRPDVLPVDDLGLQRAVRQQYGPADCPIIDQINNMAAQWRPFTTVASWYLWRSLELS
jgi:DNA-3-methyladenine glycosylase II